MSSRSFLLACAVAGGLIQAGDACAAQARGAGATFPQPLYDRWAKAYGSISSAVVTYQGTGSGDGIKQVTAGTIDFGGSDMPMAASDLAKGGFVQFPTVIGGVVLVANVPGMDPGSIVLDGDNVRYLLTGKSPYWDDPAIARGNPSLSLPHLKVVPIHRSDSSGTTFVVSDYLSKVGSWTGGRGTTVKWPTGIEARGSDGMVQAVAAQPGAIGYVEYSYAKRAGLAYVDMVNVSGRVVQPTPSSFSAASDAVDWRSMMADPDKGLVNEPGGASWPLTTTTYVIMKPPGKDDRPGPATAAAMFEWALDKGGSIANDLDYVPLPPAAVAEVRARLGVKP